MKRILFAGLLAAAAMWLSGCAAQEPAEPVPFETENQTVTVSFGEQGAEGVYTGWMLGDVPHGDGSFAAANGLSFAGSFADGAAGQGDVENLPWEIALCNITYTGTYTGTLEGGLPTGQGHFTGQSMLGLALEYTGSWRDGQPRGEGHLEAGHYAALWQGTLRPGTYAGETFDLLPQGEGCFTGQDELGFFSYTGQWDAGAFHGQGRLAYEGNRTYVRQGTFCSGSFTPSYFEALNTVGTYEPLFSLREDQVEFLSQYPGLWDEEHTRRNYLKSEYSKLIDNRYYHALMLRTPEKYENTWLRLNHCRLIDRREVTFDNGLTIHTLTAVDGTYTYTYQCYLVGDIPEDLRQRSTMDMYVVPVGMSEYTNPLGETVPCSVVLVGDIRIR